MSMPVLGVTNCKTCMKPLKIGESSFCKECQKKLEEKRKQERIKAINREKQMTYNNINKDLKRLQRQIQQVVDKYDSKIKVYYPKESNKVHLSINFKV